MAETLDVSERSGESTSSTSASNTPVILKADRSNGGAGHSSTALQEEVPTSASVLPCPRTEEVSERDDGSSSPSVRPGSKSGDEASALSQTLEQLDLEGGGSGPFNATLDEFLMTALRSNKDRMFLLKLDREFGFFINDPLPALRFSDLVEEEEEQVVKPIQLLKRNPDRATPAPSESSESAPEPERKTMSIKEREEAYARARARIFQDCPSNSKTPDSSSGASHSDSPATGSTSTALPATKSTEPDDSEARSSKQKKQLNSTSSIGSSSSNSSSNGAVANNNSKKKRLVESHPGSPELTRSPDAVEIGRPDWTHSNSSSRNVSRSGSPTTPTPMAQVGYDSVRKPKNKLSKPDLQMDNADGRRRRSTASTTSSTSGVIRTPVGLARTESSSSSQDGHHSPGPSVSTTVSPAAISPMYNASTPPKGHDYFGMDPQGVAPSHSRTHTPTHGRVNSPGIMKGSVGQSYNGKKTYPPAGYNSTNVGQYGLNANTGYPSVQPHHGPYTHPVPTGPPPSQPTGSWMADPMQYQAPDLGSYSGPGFSPGGPGPHPGHPQAPPFHAPPHQYKQPMEPGFQQPQQRPPYSHHQHHYPSHSQPHIQHSNYYPHPQQPHQQHGSYQHPGQPPHHHHHQHYQPYYQPNHPSARGNPTNNIGGSVRPRYTQDHQFQRSPSHKRYNQLYDANKNVNNMNGGYHGSGAQPQQQQPQPQQPQQPSQHQHQQQQPNASFEMAPMGPVNGHPVRPQGHRSNQQGGQKYGKHKNQPHGWNGTGYAYQAGNSMSGTPWIGNAPGANGVGHNNRYHHQTGYGVMSGSASPHVFDIERRPPKSTELFDPKGPQTSSGLASAGASSSHEGGGHSVTEASTPTAGDSTPTHEDNAHVPIVMSRSYSSTSTSSSGQAPTQSFTGGASAGILPCPSNKKNLVYDYSVPTTAPYDGVLKSPSQEKSMPEHILELYGFHPEDDFVEDLALPAGAKLKHIKPTGSSGAGSANSSGSTTGAHGQYLVIFRTAALASEALAAFQSGQETWLKKSSRLSFTTGDEQAAAGQEESEGGEQEEGKQQQSQILPRPRNSRFMVRVWVPVLVQSLLPTVGGPPGSQPRAGPSTVSTTNGSSATNNKSGGKNTPVTESSPDKALEGTEEGSEAPANDRVDNNDNDNDNNNNDNADEARA
ncbi:hypothetical protein BGW42_000221 [Actinomortierella wolfii]|nr:hypothetical protein BGW42_000221 [Actinomortierella wolfii]